MKVAIYSKFFTLSCPLAAYMLLLLEGPRFKLLKSQTFKLFSSIFKDLFWQRFDDSHQQTQFYAAVIITILNLSFSVCIFHYRLCYKTQTHLLLFLLCLTIFIKKNLYFIFTYLIILFARTNFKKETKHGHCFEQGRKVQN